MAIPVVFFTLRPGRWLAGSEDEPPEAWVRITVFVLLPVLQGWGLPLAVQVDPEARGLSGTGAFWELKSTQGKACNSLVQGLQLVNT